ncbi:MAG: ion transporter, partial [Candidatus Thiodiazotropha endolucinida]
MSKMLIHPDRRFKVVWEIYVLVVTTFITISAPLRVVFSTINPTLLLFCDTVGTLTFLADIIIKFNTGIMIRQELVTNRKTIAIHYLRGMFIFDLIAALPFSWIFAYSQAAFVKRIFRYFLLLRLFKLLSITKTLKRAHRISIIKPAFIRLMLLVFWILIAAHIIACGWIFIDGPGKISSETPLTSRAVYLEAFYWTVTTLTTIGY